MEIIIGAAVSLLVQFLKRYEDNDWLRLLLVLLVSLVAGAVYYFFVDTSYLESARDILIAAGAVYAFIIQRFEN